MALRTNNAATLDYMRARGMKVAGDPVEPRQPVKGKPTKGQPVDDELLDDQELDENGDPIVDPEDLTDEQADKEAEKLKSRWQQLIRSECRSTGCDPTKAMSKVAKQNPGLRHRMIQLGNRTRHSSSSRSRSRR